MRALATTQAALQQSKFAQVRQLKHSASSNAMLGGVGASRIISGEGTHSSQVARSSSALGRIVHTSAKRGERQFDEQGKEDESSDEDADCPMLVETSLQMGAPFSLFAPIGQMGILADEYDPDA